MANVPRTTVKRKNSVGEEDIRGEAMAVDEPVKEAVQHGKMAGSVVKVEGEGQTGTAAAASGGGKKKKKAKR